MKKIRVAVNGLGRIGRAFLKLAVKRYELEIVAVNDLGEAENLAYLLRHDSVYGSDNTKAEARVDGGKVELLVNGHRMSFLSEHDPYKLPWRELGIDVVVEATGAFEDYQKAKVHIDAGAKRVVISAPAKGEGEGKIGRTVLMGVNEDDLKTFIISSNASCTTNAGSPIMAILDETIGIEKAILNTVHAYTATQNLVDGPDKYGDFLRGRAAAVNIVPSTTGAAIAVTKAIKRLSGKFDGVAARVPVICGSLADITFIASRNTTEEEVNEILRAAAKQDRWKNIFGVTEEPLVSSDIIGDTRASVADLSFTKVVDGNLVKVLAWYDNEMGYAQTLVLHVIRAGEV